MTSALFGLLFRRDPGLSARFRLLLHLSSLALCSLSLSDHLQSTISHLTVSVSQHHALTQRLITLGILIRSLLPAEPPDSTCCPSLGPPHRIQSRLVLISKSPLRALHSCLRRVQNRTTTDGRPLQSCTERDVDQQCRSLGPIQESKFRWSPRSVAKAGTP